MEEAVDIKTLFVEDEIYQSKRIQHIGASFSKAFKAEF